MKLLTIISIFLVNITLYARACSIDQLNKYSSRVDYTSISAVYDEVLRPGEFFCDDNAPNGGCIDNNTTTDGQVYVIEGQFMVRVWLLALVDTETCSVLSESIILID